MPPRRTVRYSVFLHGEYHASEHEFYRRAIAESTSIAADGGLLLFSALRLTPDIALGDFDTVPDAPVRLAGKCEIIQYPTAKDKSDGQLGVELAIARGATEITLYGYRGGDETDHIFGNLTLLSLAGKIARRKKVGITISAASQNERVWLVDNSALIVRGQAGDTVSIAPLDRSVTISAKGLEYPAEGLRVERGSTRSFRNVMKSSTATIQVSGAALVFRRDPTGLL